MEKAVAVPGDAAAGRAQSGAPGELRPRRLPGPGPAHATSRTSGHGWAT